MISRKAGLNRASLGVHFVRRWVFVVITLLLSACAAQQAYREGQLLLVEGKPEAGLAKLEEAVRLKPHSAEYRITLLSQRASLVNQLLMTAESQRRDGMLAEAEKAYQHALRIASDHPMARQGLEALIVERRHRQVVSQAEEIFQKGDMGGLQEVGALLQGVLAENPAQKGALNLKSRLDEVQRRDATPITELAAAFKKPITIVFRDAPLRSIFDVVSEVSSLNFVFDKDIRPDLKATITAKKSSIEEVVRILLLTNQLEMRVLNSNSVLLYPSNPQKQKDYRALSVRTFYLANADAKSVANTLKTILKTPDMIVDERLNLIILRDTPEAIRIADRLVALQDIADPEVMLDVQILEIKRSRLLDLGVSWPNQVTLAPLTVGDTPLTLAQFKNLNSESTKVGIGNVALKLRKEDQDGNVLASPRIRVRNKEKAKVMIGDRVPVITTTSTSTGFVSDSVNYVDVGLKLEVEPNIHLDEEVAIRIGLEVSNLVREVISKSGTLSYQIGTRNANTVLRLKDGETQILAGLISNEERSSADKIPGLGELPILSRLFGSQKDDRQRSEIILSITPHLVRTIRRPDLVTASFNAGTESMVGMPEMSLRSQDEPAVASANKQAPPGKSATLPAEVVASPPAATVEPVDPAPPVGSSAVTASLEAVSLTWQGPAKSRTGDSFTLALNLQSHTPLQGMPFLIQYDPTAIQVVAIEEGSFFRQAGGDSNFSHRIDAKQGKAFVAVVRSGSTINGQADLANLTFKSLRPGVSSIRLLSATPEPVLPFAGSLPEHAITIGP